MGTFDRKPPDPATDPPGASPHPAHPPRPRPPGRLVLRPAAYRPDPDPGRRSRPQHHRGERLMKLVDLAELREQACEHGDMRLAAMNDRELKATALENYCGPDATETVIRTRAIEARHR